MKTDNKKKNYKYDLGSFVTNNGAGIGQAAGFLGQAVGGGAGNVLSSAGSGAALGTAIAPGIGTAIGAGVGLIAGIFGNKKKKRAEARAKRENMLNSNEEYNDFSTDQLDTINENPYGNDIIFKDGGVVPSNFINIEQGELQIDPKNGKILRKYDKINPETGGMYKPHSKGKDTKDNFVTADPGTFIITKEKAKDYLSAIENNDKLHQNSILQNIANFKKDAVKSDKMATGSFVQDPTKPLTSKEHSMEMYFATAFEDPKFAKEYRQNIPLAIDPSTKPRIFNYTSPGFLQKPTLSLSTLPQNTNPVTARTQASSGGFGFSDALNLAPSLLNIGQGLFGKVDQQQQVQAIRNPYTNQVLNNMPQDVSFEPIRRDLQRQQQGQFNQIANTTSSSAIARANMNNVAANTNAQLGKLRLDNDLANNQVKAQRSSIYNQLGAQDMNSQQRAQQINLGIDESNMANRAAKTNLLNTGLSQLQQTYQNTKLNNSKQNIDMYKLDLMKQMFPNLKYYGNQFGSDALLKLIGK